MNLYYKACLSIVGFGHKFKNNMQGVTAIEYAIVAAGVAGVVMFIFNTDNGAVKETLDTVFTTLKTRLQTAINGSAAAAATS